MKKKTLLVYPRFGWEIKDGQEGDAMHPAPPLGIAFLAGVLRKNEYQVKIADMTFDNSEDVFKNTLKTFRPDIVGIEVLSIGMGNLSKVAKWVKEILPDSLVVAGGPHPTVFPESVTKINEVDIIVLGEGEYVLLDIVSCKSLKTIKGIQYKKGNKWVKNSLREPIQNLDDIPYPARDMLPMKKYLDFPFIEPLPYPATSILTGRGCYFNCKFCQPISKKLFGSKVRLRSPENVVEEIKYLIKEYKIKGLDIEDDLFVFSEKYVREFCQLIIKNNIKVKWRCNARVDTVNREKLKWMKKAGCVKIIFGVESGSQKMLDHMGKGTSVEQIKNAFKWSHEAGILTMANFIVGYPGETKETLQESLNVVREIDSEIVDVNVATPMPGSELYNQVFKQGSDNITDWSNYNRGFFGGIKLENLDENDLENYRNLMYKESYKHLFKRFLFNPAFVFPMFYRTLTLTKKPRYLTKLMWNYFVALTTGTERKRVV